MHDEIKSNKLWKILKARALKNRLYKFTRQKHGVLAVTIESFAVKIKLKNGRINTRRTYYRVVRDDTGTVLYDQLEDILAGFVEKMAKDGPIPDIAISPSRSNNLLSAILEQQAEIDQLITEARA